jgi:hypothetical protein
MFSKTLPKNGEKILDLLNKDNLLNDFYLAGGTGLALQIGHRKSMDFDFFSKNKFDTNYYITRLHNLGDFNLLDEAKGTVTGTLYNVKISFFHYNYPLLWNLDNFNEIKVADIKDIGLMKFTAIAGRGTKKDFIDLYYIAKNHISLSKLFSHFDDKYGSTYNRYHILKSLIYFDDAENDKEPEMLEEMKWKSVKQFFINEEKVLFNNFIYS